MYVVTLLLCLSLPHTYLTIKDVDDVDDELVRLERLFHKIDSNSDREVSRDELVHWIESHRRRMNNADTVKEFKRNDVDGDGEVTWDEHTQVYWQENKQNEYNKHRLADDERRFKLADREGDLKLGSLEFAGFLHPEDDDGMVQQMVSQTVGHMDSNNDGVVSIEEYLADLWSGDGDEPKWLKTEREEFSKYRDQNKNGVMERNEVKDWIFPREKEVRDQVNFLVEESDADANGMLTKEEMMLNFHLFLGSAEFREDEDKKMNFRDEL